MTRLTTALSLSQSLKQAIATCRQINADDVDCINSRIQDATDKSQQINSLMLIATKAKNRNWHPENQIPDTTRVSLHVTRTSRPRLLRLPMTRHQKQVTHFPPQRKTRRTLGRKKQKSIAVANQTVVVRRPLSPTLYLIRSG